MDSTLRPVIFYFCRPRYLVELFFISVVLDTSSNSCISEDLENVLRKTYSSRTFSTNILISMRAQVSVCTGCAGQLFCCKTILCSLLGDNVTIRRPSVVKPGFKRRSTRQVLP